MTRFARAKGSKSCNERTPEDSTPWEVMQDQILQSKNQQTENKKREEVENQRIENYNNFLKERKVQKKKADWCEFPETNTKTPPKKKVKKEAIINHPTPTQNHSEETVVKNKKNKKHEKSNNNKNEETIYHSTNSEAESLQTTSNSFKEKFQNKIEKKKDFPDNFVKSDNFEQQPYNSYNTPQHQNKKEKKKKFDNHPVQRRKPIADQSFQLIINGKEIELSRYDGFPIMKRDAERIEELKNSMINKGIPKSEVQRTIKLERRRAEKALARLKREVCYNCRKGGHNLSDCPDLKNNITDVENSGSGLCFKCGSTEHRQFECKVQRDKEFRFAKCFICKDQGHIARQCPDNPKGLYPNGGGCKLCGDVTHLRKDCPTVMDKKEESNIKANTFDDNNDLEDIGQTFVNKSKTENSVKKPKKIKF